MTKFAVSILVSLFLSGSVRAQEQFKLFDKIWGDARGSVVSYADQFSNKDYLLVGAYKTESLSGQYYVCRSDSGGNILWNIDLGFDNAWDYLTKVIKTKSGSYLILGYSEGDTLPGFREWVVWNIDSSGNVLFEKYFSSGYDNRPCDIVETSDSCFVIAGVLDPPSSMTWRLSVLKIDPDGNEIWRNRVDSLGNYIPGDIEQLSDGSYIVIGQESTVGIPFFSKFNSSGQLVWVKYPYGNSGNSGAFPIKVFATSDTAFSVYYAVNYISTSSTQVWTIKKDYNSQALCQTTTEYGQRIWNFSDHSPNSPILCISPTYDTVYKLNSDGSFTQIANLDPSESSQCKTIFYAIRTSDGGCLGVGSGLCGINTSYYMVKFGPDGRYGAQPFSESINVFPNPSYTGEISLSFDMTEDHDLSIAIYDSEGRIVYKNQVLAPANTHTELPINLEIETASTGVYFLLIQSDESVFRQKIVVAH